MNKRKLQLRKAQRLRNNRRKLVMLRPEEREAIARAKEFITEINREGVPYNSIRDLKRVNKAHGRDMEGLVVGLSKKFPNQRIEVLDEGAGDSSFHYDLARALKTRELAYGKSAKIDLGVTRTDIDTFMRHSHTGASPEQLIEKFGRDKFQLVVSTFGGTNYTPLKQEKAIANIIGVLKPGGVASIVTDNIPQLGGREVILANLKKVIKNHKNIVMKEHKNGAGKPVITIFKLK